MFVPYFKILGAVVPEKSLMEKKVYTQAHRQNIVMEKTKTIYPYTSYACGITTVYWGSSKVVFKKLSQNFVKPYLKFCLISQSLVQTLWHILYVYKMADNLPGIFKHVNSLHAG